MEVTLAVLSGLLVAVAVYLLLRRHLVRMVVGLIVLSNAVNLLIFTMGRLTRVSPPIVPDGRELPAEVYANPLPQALILTAIVISFGILAYAIALIYITYDREDVVDSDALRREQEGDETASAAGRTLPV